MVRMKTLKTALQGADDFADFVYERYENTSIYTKQQHITFQGGLFVFEEKQTHHDIDGFEVGTIVEKKYCTIEKVRRELLQKENKETFIASLDQYEADQAIAQIVLLFGA